MTDEDWIPTHHLATGAEEAAVMMRALSNPSRLLILCYLVEAERSVGEIEKELGLGQAYVSQQLARLRAENMVAARREGRTMWYRLSDSRVRPVMKVIFEQFCPPL